MNQRESVVGLARVSDAQAMAAMSRDLVEAGLGWEYRGERVAKMIADRETIAIVTRDGPRIAGFAIITFGRSAVTWCCLRSGRRITDAASRAA